MNFLSAAVDVTDRGFGPHQPRPGGALSVCCLREGGARGLSGRFARALWKMTNGVASELRSRKQALNVEEKAAIRQAPPDALPPSALRAQR